MLPPIKGTAHGARFAAKILPAVSLITLLVSSCSVIDNKQVAQWSELRDDAELKIGRGLYRAAQAEAVSSLKLIDIAHGDKFDRVRCLLTLGRAHLLNGHYNEVIATLQEAEAILQGQSQAAAWLRKLGQKVWGKPNSDTWLLLQTKQYLGDAHMHLADYQESQSELDQAAALAEQLLKDDRARAENAKQSRETLTKMRRVIFTHQLRYAGILAQQAELARLRADYAASRRHLDTAMQAMQDLLEVNRSDVALVYADLLNVRANLELDQCRFDEGEKSIKTALAYACPSVGLWHPQIIASTNTLIRAYYLQGRYRDALHAINTYREHEKRVMPYHPTTMKTLVLNAACISNMTHGHHQLEPQFEYMMPIDKRIFGSNSPEVAEVLQTYGEFEFAGGKHGSAQEKLNQALTIMRSRLGPDHPRLAPVLNSLASLELLHKPLTGAQLDQSERYASDALKICQHYNASFSTECARSHNTLGVIYSLKHKVADAEQQFRALSALPIAGAAPSNDVVCGLRNYASLLRMQKRNSDAKAVEARALEVENDAAARAETFRLHQVGDLFVPDGT